MRHILNSFILAFSVMLVSAGFSSISNSEILADDPWKANSDGWHVRICETQTTAQRVNFSAGAADDSHDKTRNFRWRQGRSNVVEIHKDYRYKTDLYLEVSLGKNEKATICLLYDNRVVKTFNVTQEIKITINNAETDSCPC